MVENENLIAKYYIDTKNVFLTANVQYWSLSVFFIIYFNLSLYQFLNPLK